MNSHGRKGSHFRRFHSFFCACLGFAFSAGLSRTAAAAFLPMSDPPAQSLPTPGLSPVILSDGWAIRDVQTNDLGSVAFVGGGHYYGEDYSSAGVADGVVLVTANGINKLAGIGDPVPDRPGRVFAGFESQALNNHDDVAFVALSLPAGDSSNCLQIPWPSSCVPGLYLYSGGHIRETAVSGGAAPDAGGRSFVWFGSPQLNDNNMIAFWGYVGVDDMGSIIDGYFLFDGHNTHKIAIRGENSPLLGPIGHLSSDAFFLSSGGTLTFCANGIVAQYAGGKLRKILASGDFIPGGGTVPQFDQLVSISGNREREVVFETRGVPYEKSGLYLLRRDGQVVRILSHGDPTPSIFGGGNFSMTYRYRSASLPRTGLSNLNAQINDSGDVLFISSVTGSFTVAGIFLYSGGQIVYLANDGEPIPSNPALPEHWTTTWTNSGKGEASEYDSSGQDSFEGKIDLRLRVAAAGGAVFVVSDPIPVSDGTDYFLQCRMRYNLSGGSDSVYFTVIQFDGSGNAVGLDETRGVQGDNFWTWQPKRLLIHTASNAAVIRIRFGLIAASESYIDVDAVGGRDSP
jgi:hypothetical protein